jgi:hypothetical protein
VVGYGDSESDFTINVFEELKRLNWNLIEIEEVEFYEERVKNYEVSEEIKKIATYINKKNLVGFSTFNLYKK